MIRQIKETVDIVSLVGQYVQIHRAGNRFKALCPFHDDKNPSMEVNPARQSFKCWACGVGGDCIEFVQKYERVDFPEAIRILADRLGIQMEKQSPQYQAAKGPAKADLFQVLSWAAGFYAGEFMKHEESRGYVAERGLMPEIVGHFGLGYLPADSNIIERQARAMASAINCWKRRAFWPRQKDGHTIDFMTA
ncbi:MAG: CHC2 zinc finger domain-containing protein [bacterium]